MDTLADRFWRRVEPEPMSGCFLWLGYRNHRGYGLMWDTNEMRFATRVAWKLHFGEIPNGLSVLHRCDLTSCVRPEHLFLGTHTDNMRDAAAKGRLAAQKEGPRLVCAAGLHAMTPFNVYIHPTRGKRSCKACQVQRGREWRERERHALLARLGGGT